MFAKIKNNEFVGFFNEKIEDDTCDFIEIEEIEYLKIIENQNINTKIIVENNKLKLIKLNEFEFIENNEVKFDRQGKIEKIKKELYDIRIEKEVAPFEFEVNGKTYLQQNRLIDQSSITKVLFQMIIMFIYKLMLNALKGKIPNLTTIMTEAQKLSFKNWKFYTVDNSEKYENVTIMNFLEMSQKMNLQTTISMVTETELKHKLDTLTDDEVRNFNAVQEYEKRFNEEMIEAIKENNNILGG